jgi:hypothetical protein
VGIGIANPGVALDINGNSEVRGGFLRVGRALAPGGDAKVELGEGRTSDGNATFDLVADNSVYPDFGVRFVRFATGLSQFSHRGTQPLAFNSVDGGTIFFQTSGINRLRVNSNGVLPGADNTTSLGNSTSRWTELWSVNGTIQTSDARTKSDIEDSKYGLKEVMQLKPVTFKWKDSPDYGLKVGFLAQDVEQVIPEVVRTKQATLDTDGKRSFSNIDVMGINYAELVPVLVGAIQEQQAVIEEKEARLEELTLQVEEIQSQLAKVLDAVSDLNSGTKVGIIKSQVEVRGNDLASLSQNRPNPFNGLTVIDYEVPTSAKQAQLNFYNPNGQLIKTVAVDHTGVGELTFKATDIPSGTYSYSLVVDGEAVNTKQMVLTR